MSVATAGKKVKLVGKSSRADMDPAAFARYGVSEILTPDQCLKRLHGFLCELEQDVEGPKVESTKFTIHALIGVSEQTDEIRRTIKILADVDFPSALLLGETGTGKSLVARVLHNSGLRSRYNLVEVNCSTIPDELFESELFGHVKGSFTDAKSDKPGLFEHAREGTLFLDEVGN